MNKYIVMPTTIEVLGVDVPIIVTDEQMEDCFGCWELATGTITIATGIEPDHLRVTLLHELLHAIDDLTGSGMKHSHIYIISQILFCVMKSNPGLGEWFLGEAQCDTSS